MTTTLPAKRFAEYLTVSQAAHYLGVSPWTLRNWDKSGKLKPQRHPKNGYRIYRHEELSALLEPASAFSGSTVGAGQAVNWTEIGPSEHFVQFYESDDYLCQSVAGFLAEALRTGGGAMNVATPEHRHAVESRLQAAGIDLAACRARGQYIACDAAQALAQFTVGEAIDTDRFAAVVTPLVEAAGRNRPRLHAFGEMVALLWTKGNRAAAIHLEELWNELGKKHQLALYCAYPIQACGGAENEAPFSDICRCHTRVIPAESYNELPTADDRSRAILQLQRKAQSLEVEIAHRKEVEAALTRRERELTDFFEQAVEGIHQVGPDGRILWANKAELKLLGYEAHEYIGRSIKDFHVDQDVIADMLARLGGGETLYNRAARLRCKDGSIKHVLVHSNACFEGGKLAYSRCFTRDVTALREAEEALRVVEQRFARFMRHLPGLAWIKDMEGRYVFVNDAAARTFGHPADELCNKTDGEVFPADTAARFRENDHRALASESGVQVIETLQHDDGAVHHSLVSKFPIPGADGQPLLIGGMAIDITDRIRAEQSLEEMNRRKDEFLATLAHELRNPLAPISNALQMLDLNGRLDDEGREARLIMERQMQQMVRLVDDLLDVSRMTRGKLELRTERIDLCDALRCAMESSEPLIEAMNHRLSVAFPDAPVRLDGDFTRLTQVFTNLLNNAAKYMPRGGEIELGVELQGEWAVVAITDRGVGMEPKDLAKIFEMFEQVDQSLERSQGGLGIGLTLVRKLVELHGGAVEATSEGRGKGSRFVVRLPLAEDAKPNVLRAASSNSVQAESSAPVVGPPSLRRILVVDDNRDAADTLAMMLRLMGNEVRTAHDGMAAVEATTEFRPQVIFMDVGMPRLNGYDATRRIRQLPGGDRIEIFTLSGWDQAEDKQRSQDAGCTSHLVKPVEFALLKDILSGPVASLTTP